TSRRWPSVRRKATSLLGVYGLLGNTLLLLELSHFAPGRLVALRRTLGQRLDVQLPVSINSTLASSARRDRRLAVYRRRLHWQTVGTASSHHLPCVVHSKLLLKDRFRHRLHLLRFRDL